MDCDRDPPAAPCRSRNPADRTSPAALLALDDDALLEAVARQTFALLLGRRRAASFLARDRSPPIARDPPNDLVAVGGSGFGLMALVVAVERGWVAAAPTPRGSRA